MQEKIFEEGIVSESNQGTVKIKLSANEHCSECSAQLFCNPQKDSSKSLVIDNHPELKKGDHVSISILGKSLFRASLNLYLYPLLILITVIFVGTELFYNSDNPEIYSVLLAFPSVIIYYFILLHFNKRFRRFKPRIVISKLNYI